MNVPVPLPVKSNTGMDILRPLPGQNFHLLEQRTFHGAPGPVQRVGSEPARGKFKMSCPIPRYQPTDFCLLNDQFRGFRGGFR